MLNTLQRLLDLIQKEHHLDITGVTLETGLSDVGLDSLALAELIFSIEDTFHVELGDMDPRSMPATVGELVALIDASNPTKAAADSTKAVADSTKAAASA